MTQQDFSQDDEIDIHVKGQLWRLKQFMRQAPHKFRDRNGPERKMIMTTKYLIYLEMTRSMEADTSSGGCETKETAFH